MAKKESKKTKASNKGKEEHKDKLSTKAYEAELYKLHADLVTL